MADLTVTAANVQHSAGASFENLIAGVAITAGQLLYKDAAGLAQLADCDLSDAAAEVYGIAANNAAAGQPVAVVRTDPDFDPGATTTPGTPYYASATAGGIAPQADLTTGWRVRLVGWGKASNKLRLAIVNVGITL